MTDCNPSVVSKEAWVEARLAHLGDEKAFTQQRDELSRKRRELPWLEVSQHYDFDGPEGKRTLSDLFEGHSQLLIYHFMLGPGWSEGCPSCSFWADNYEGIGVHLEARDTALVAVSRGTLGEITSYKDRMGWKFPWYSSNESSFNYDMGVSWTPEEIEAGTAKYNFGTQPVGVDELPGISVFTKGGDAQDTGKVFLTYQTFSRGLDMLNGAYHMLDLTPKGRDEQDLDWSMQWLHRHDDYPANTQSCR